MAQIDLKYAKIIISDGTSQTGSVNPPSYSSGGGELGIKNYIGELSTNDTFTIAGESTAPTHTILGTGGDGGGGIIEISFSTNLASTIADNAAITFAARTANVNHSGGYTSTDLTIVIANYHGIVKPGEVFHIAGESGTPAHTVTSHSETTGNTTSVTFTGAIVGTISDNTVITFGTRSANIQTRYLSGVTSVAFTGITGELTTGGSISFPDEDGTPDHTILTHTETSTNTTSVTFTPALASRINKADVITAGANHLEINIGEGNLSYTEKRDITYVRNRGRLSTVRLGDEQPVEISIDFIWEHITSSDGDPPTIEECVKGEGGASHWLSSGTDKCEPYAVDLKVIYTPPCSTEEMETITLQDFRWEELDHNFKDATVAVKGKCNVIEAIAVRTTNTYPN